MKTLSAEMTPRHLQGGRGFLHSTWWTWLVLLTAGGSIGILSLLFAIGPYQLVVFKSYFHHPLILFLNLAPVVLLLCFFYFLYGRMMAAYITTASIVIGLSFTDYYVLKFRDDPLMFTDFVNAKEAFSITAKQKYDLTPDRRMWFGIGCVLLGVGFVYLFVRHRIGMQFRQRALLALIPAALMIPLGLLIADAKVYTTATANNDFTNQWSATQVYLSKGFVYPFLHSISSDTLKKPDGYHAADAKKILSAYSDESIPDDQKVSIVTLQLEAFCDLSPLGVEGVDWDAAYGTYHDILNESYHGRLITNIFAGGTVNTERCFLTGFVDLKNIRSATNSYACYFADQGYAVTGSHPSYEWFYNRENINAYLGFPEYWYYENHYSNLADGAIASDEILLPEIYNLYEQEHADGSPVFSFNVTYQGHGPYDSTSVWRGEHYTDGRYTKATANILDNYLGSVRNTSEQIRTLLDRFAAQNDPVIVVLYGDHKPWLGYDSAAYNELGISLDLSTDQGFYNKYCTDYVIWANDAAKRAVGNSFIGEGPDLSSNYLMNELFDLCSWKGSAYLQATEEIRKQLPVVTSVGRISDGGTLVREDALSETGQEKLREFQLIQYYWEKNFADSRK